MVNNIMREDIENYHQTGGTYIIPIEVMNLLLDEYDTMKDGIDNLLIEYLKLQLINDDLLEEAIEKKDVLKIAKYRECLRYIIHIVERLNDLKEGCK